MFKVIAFAYNIKHHGEYVKNLWIQLPSRLSSILYARRLNGIGNFI